MACAAAAGYAALGAAAGDAGAGTRTGRARCWWALATTAFAVYGVLYRRRLPGLPPLAVLPVLLAAVTSPGRRGSAVAAGGAHGTRRRRSSTAAYGDAPRCRCACSTTRTRTTRPPPPLTSLPDVSGTEALPVAQAALRLAFPGRALPEETRFASLDGRRRRLVRVLAKSPGTWLLDGRPFGNVGTLVRSYGLPGDVDAMAAYMAGTPSPRRTR
ncbi:hypothetical protein AB0D98_04710 [Streptomyces sp. NPDC047987]|uniref:hypothetical protein n=1 Tax=unclassified Streptomyces TaxID=2593676 RepID=UPI00343FC3A4